MPIKFFGAIKGDKAPVKETETLKNRRKTAEKPPSVVKEPSNNVNSFGPHIQLPIGSFGLNGNNLYPNALNVQNQPNKQFNILNKQKGNLPINAQNPFAHWISCKFKYRTR